MGKYYKGTTALDSDSEIAKYSSKLSSDVSTFKMSTYKYNGDSDTSYITAGGLSGWSSIWGNDALNKGYYSGTSAIPFTDITSCPLPIGNNTNRFPFSYYGCSGGNPGEGSVPLYLKYDSSAKECKYKLGDNGTWYSCSSNGKFKGVFVILQGAGGGGGEGNSINVGFTSACSGGSGGGGGAFICAYLNLAKIKDTSVKLVAGDAGERGGSSGDHAWTDVGRNGGSGGSSVLVYSGTNVLVAAGGNGGKGGGSNGTEGGAGGSVSSTDYSWLKLVMSRGGGKGGINGDISGYTAGVPYGLKTGGKGSSAADSSSNLSFPMYSTSYSATRQDSDGSKYYFSKGQATTRGTNNAYTSCGGGGGGAVMGLAEDDGNNYGRRGYGIGGGGGPAESATVHASNRGMPGYVGFLYCQKP